MISDSLRRDIQKANIDLLREMKIEPSALENGYVPVDIDVTPFDNSKTKKEGVSHRETIALCRQLTDKPILGDKVLLILLIVFALILTYVIYL